jgi:hypothetical protein
MTHHHISMEKVLKIAASRKVLRNVAGGAGTVGELFQFLWARLLVSEPATLTITLLATEGDVVHEAAFQLQRDQPIDVESSVPAGTRANRIRIEISSAGNGRAWLTDVRVEGQTPALERYIKTRLRFPAAPAGFER